MKLLLMVTLTFMTTFANAETNPLLSSWWNGPHDGVPPFDKIKVSDFKPALEQGMAETRKEIEAISNNPQPPTFDNTILAMEKMGRTFGRVASMYGVWSSVMKTAEFQVVEQEWAPKLAAFQDELYQNGKLFKRIETIYNSPEKSKLTPEQQRLVWYQFTQFSRRGGKLNDEQKKRAGVINQRLATLSTQFQQNQLSDEENYSIVIDKEADLAGLPKSAIENASATAERKNQKGKWIFPNTRSGMEPILTYSSNRALREKAFKMWTSRGDNGGTHDNNKIVTEILQLRQERAKLLGYESFAAWHLADGMAKTPENAMDLMMKVWAPAVAQEKKEVADMQAVVDAEGGKFKIQPWDYRFYAEKVRKAKYDLDLDLVKPYLQLDHLREAMFWVAGQLYGFKFTQLKDVPVYHSGVTVYQVSGPGKKNIGLWYFDPYAREGKQSGAWMNNYRDQQKVDGKPVKTIVSNNSNFIEGKPGEPVLVSWDDATTMFHEFGHALHGLNSNVTYPTLSGTATAQDFVEFPSQINENWLRTNEVLHFLTNKEGKPLPKDLIARIEKAKNFNQGFATVEFLASAIVDMKLHLTQTKVDPKEFEKKTLAEIGMPSEIVMRHRIPAFGHLFSSEDYAAGYYGYLWAEVLDHDAFEAFLEAKGPYDKKVAKRLRDYIMSIGNTVDPAVAYRNFRGRDPSVDALLRARGFPAPPAATSKM